MACCLLEKDKGWEYLPDPGRQKHAARMMARHTAAPVNVIALIGERGREVNEFIEKDLGREGLDHSVVIVATPTSQRQYGFEEPILPALLQNISGSGAGRALYDGFGNPVCYGCKRNRARSRRTTNFQRLHSECFRHLPQLLERAGTSKVLQLQVCIPVLVEGDDLEDPVADALRSILDGHIVLDRRLAHRHQYPAINILKSVSRLTDQLLTREQRQAIAHFVQTLARYETSEDMINIGAYVAGTNPETDYAIAMYDKLCQYLKQPVDKKCPSTWLMMPLPLSVRPSTDRNG